MANVDANKRGHNHSVREERRAEIQRVFDTLGLHTEQQRQAHSFQTVDCPSDRSEQAQRFIPRLSNTSDILE